MPTALYAVADIHGHKAMLDEALRRIDSDGGTGARVVFLGDLIDRGPDSRGVIDTLIAGQAEARDWIVLRGNHEQMMLEFLGHGPGTHSSGRPRDAWLTAHCGGRATLASYGVTAGSVAACHVAALRSVSAEHRTWLAALPYYHETEELLFVHAGIRPRVPFPLQRAEDLLWIREPFLSDFRDHGKLVVHGHTPLPHPVHYGNRINLDGGAGQGGALHVARFEGRNCFLLCEHGRLPLRPEPGRVVSPEFGGLMQRLSRHPRSGRSVRSTRG